MSEESEENSSDFKVATQVKSTGSLFMPVALGLAGIIIGAVALYMTFNNAKRFNNSGNALVKKSELVYGLRQDLKEMKERMVELELKSKKETEQVESLVNQTQSAFIQVGREVGATRTQVSKNAEKITEIINGFKAPVAQPIARAKSKPKSISQTINGSSKTREHVITSGDTFAKLATKYNISIDAILATNPDVDPRRLQIGQKIIIPASK